MKLTIATALILTAMTVASAQPAAKLSEAGAHLVPFASESNHVELQVVNSTGAALQDVSVAVGTLPVWLRFEETSATIGTLDQGEAHVATFTFDLDEKAPVGQVADLDFDILSATGTMETRIVKIQAEAPTELTLRGNYPNPFNPSTRIAYALPSDGNVQIDVFNSIGQRVVRLVDQIQEAGYQEATWNAAVVPSGVYFYVVQLDAERTRHMRSGRMVLAK